MKREQERIFLIALLVSSNCGLLSAAGIWISNLRTENDKLRATGTALAGTVTSLNGVGQELVKCGEVNKNLILTQKALVDATVPVVVQPVTQEVTRQVTVIVKETGEVCVVAPTKTNTPTSTKRPFITFTPSSTRIPPTVTSGVTVTRRFDTAVPPTNTPQPPRDTDVPPTNPSATDRPTNVPTQPDRPTTAPQTAIPTIRVP